MALDAEFVRRRVWSLLTKYAERGAVRPPVDLYQIAHICGVQIIERPMIPEAVTAVCDRALVIYLQDNFSELPGMKARRRFTLAHEICHTLFYVNNGGSLKRLPETPRGETLEQLCHLGAAELLVPEALIRDATSDKTVLDLDLVLSLAKDFAVSVEVIIRRINEMRTPLKKEAALILLGNGADKLKVKSFCHGPWLLAHAPKLQVGMDFEPWVRHVLPVDAQLHDGEQWSVAVADGVLHSKFVRKPGLSCFEIRCAD